VNGTGTFTGAVGTRFVVPSAGGITLNGIGGPALDAANATVDARNLTLSSTNSTTTGVSLVSISDGGATNAAFSTAAGAVITSSGASTGPMFNVSGGNGAITYNGTIGNTSGGARTVTIDSWAGDDVGDDILFSGAITSGNAGTAADGGGILLNANGGSRSITFSGGINIFTSGSAANDEAFAATSNTNTGNLHVTGTNILEARSATALRVTNTGIGNSNLNFQRVSSGNSTAAADPANGIVLNNTGTAAGNGGLIITGTGTTDASGGTIQSITNRGAELSTVKSVAMSNMAFTNANLTDGGTCTDLSTAGCNAAIYLNAITSSAALTNIDVSGTTAQEGINGLSVSNFSLTNSTLANCGNAVEEGCIKMRELTGTCAITGSDLSFPGADVVEIVNTVGPTLNLDVTNSTLRDSQSSGSGNTGLQVRSQGTASMVVDVTNSSFLRIRTHGINAQAINNASNDVDVTTSTFDPGTGTMIGMSMEADNNGIMVFNIQNNPQVYSRNGPAINVFGDTSATINGRINNNPDVQVKVNVGSNVGSGIRANINKNATAKLEVKNNVVNVASDDAGIDLSGIGKVTANPGGATNTLDATVTGNNVTIGATSTYGIVILSATNAGDTNAICADVASNAIIRNPSSIASFRARVPSANGFFRMNGFVTNPEVTWNGNSNTPVSAGGSEVSFGGSGTFAACTAALPTNPGPN
jgi:hypothetical protein